MPLVKCEYCNKRVPPFQYKRHLKLECLPYRRLLKKTHAKVEPVEEPTPEPVQETLNIPEAEPVKNVPHFQSNKNKRHR